MKILMIVPEPFFSARGTPFSVYHRARALGRIGHEVDLLTYPLGRQVHLPGTRILRIPRVPLIRRVKVGPSFPKLVLDFCLLFQGFVRLCRTRYDVVHAHEESVFFCLLYRMVFWKLKFVYDMHSSLPQQLRNFSFTKNRWLIRLFSWLERRAIASANVVITICPELQKSVEGLKMKTPCVLIENTLFDLIDYTDVGDNISDRLINWQRFKDKKLILYTGTFEPYQGIPLLLECAPHVIRERPDAVFILIGGTPSQIHAMRMLAAKYGVKGQVVFPGILPPNTVKCFLRKADVLVSPRIQGTNTPLKIYEYLASGRPIVATRHPTHTQILTEREAVLTECDALSFAGGILSVLNRPEIKEGLGRQARHLYATVYGKSIYSARLKAVLQHVA